MRVNPPSSSGTDTSRTSTSNVLPRGALRISAEGEVRLSEVREYLAALEGAYNALLTLENIVDSVSVGSPLFSHPYTLREAIQLTTAEIAIAAPPRDHLVLAAVELGSPGFWEFVGKLNPLEVVRLYLCDRHERRKDREYREAAEARRLEIENKLRETELVAKIFDLAKEARADEYNLAPLLNRLLYQPLRALDQFQNNGLITSATLKRLPTPGSAKAAASNRKL